jgi:hypothetical protein
VPNGNQRYTSKRLADQNFARDLLLEIKKKGVVD